MVWQDSFTCVTLPNYMCVMCDMTHSWVGCCVTSHVCMFIRVSSHTYACVPHFTHSYVWHRSFVFALQCSVDVCDVNELRAVEQRMTWLMTHSCVWQDSFMRVTWLIYMCATILCRSLRGGWTACCWTGYAMTHGPLIRVIWLIHMRTWLMYTCAIVLLWGLRGGWTVRCWTMYNMTHDKLIWGGFG